MNATRASHTGPVGVPALRAGLPVPFGVSGTVWAIAHETVAASIHVIAAGQATKLEIMSAFLRTVSLTLAQPTGRDRGSTKAALGHAQPSGNLCTDLRRWFAAHRISD